MTSITTSVLKNVMVTFLSDPKVYQVCLIYRLSITNKISFVEMCKESGKLYLVCEKYREKVTLSLMYKSKCLDRMLFFF